MTVDLRLQIIRRSVAELAASEGDVAARLERAQQLSSGHPDTLAAIQRLRPLVQTHRDRLAAYFKDAGGVEPSGEMTSRLSTSRESNALSEALREVCLAFHNCALGYAMLFEVALRLYEPRLREIAPRHLKAHADAALLTARLIQQSWLGSSPRTGCTAHAFAPCAASAPAAAWTMAPIH